TAAASTTTTPTASTTFASASATPATAAAPTPDARGPPAAGTLVTAASGGTAAAADGSAVVTFAPGTAATDLRVVVDQSTQTVPGLDALSHVYDLHAFDAATGAPVETFASPPTLTI